MLLTYAVGDIHGSLDKLKALVEACREHADGASMRFVFLGDYIDRGPDSAGVLRFMMSLQADLPKQIIALKGNHEAWALSLLDGMTPAGAWLRNGGAETLQSYGVKDIGDLPRAHLDWMRSLRLFFDDGRRFFVHAGVNPGKPLDAQDEQELLWIRMPFLTNQPRLRPSDRSRPYAAGKRKAGAARQPAQSRYRGRVWRAADGCRLSMMSRRSRCRFCKPSENAASRTAAMTRSRYCDNPSQAQSCVCAAAKSPKMHVLTGLSSCRDLRAERRELQ